MPKVHSGICEQRRQKLAHNIINGLVLRGAIRREAFDSIMADLVSYDVESGVTQREDAPVYSWQDYWHCVFYAGTLFTTIGYGNMFCKTWHGKLATVLYSLVGIPLMLVVLNHWGQLMFKLAQNMWYSILRLIRASARRSIKAVRQGHNLVKFREKKSSTTDKAKEKTFETDAADERRQSDSKASDLVNEIEDTVPLSIALGTVVLYTFLCAGIFLLWESKWTYGQSLYFFYISLTTIGLGDQVPDHPRFALCKSV